MPVPSLLLIHGAATGAWVWDLWRRELGALGWQVNVLDLRGHGRSMPTDLSAVTLEDYVADAASVTVQIEAAQGVHPIVGGWGMGGLIAMMYAQEHAATTALFLVDSMTPGEVRKADIDTVRKYSGAILSPETFGIHPDDRERSRPALFDLEDDEIDAFLSKAAGAEESGIAFRQGLRGVSIRADSIACPTLVLSPGANEAGAEGNRLLSEYLKAELLGVPGVGHWGIVCHGSAVAEAATTADRWLRRVVELSGESSARREGDR
jgi:pimeloyl-ACP methyl ester carboxylesterase